MATRDSSEFQRPSNDGTTCTAEEDPESYPSSARGHMDTSVTSNVRDEAGGNFKGTSNKKTNILDS